MKLSILDVLSTGIKAGILLIIIALVPTAIPNSEYSIVFQTVILLLLFFSLGATFLNNAAENSKAIKEYSEVLEREDINIIASLPYQDRNKVIIQKLRFLLKRRSEMQAELNEFRNKWQEAKSETKEAKNELQRVQSATAFNESAIQADAKREIAEMKRMLSDCQRHNNELRAFKSGLETELIQKVCNDLRGLNDNQEVLSVLKRHALSIQNSLNAKK